MTARTSQGQQFAIDTLVRGNVASGLFVLNSNAAAKQESGSDADYLNPAKYAPDDSYGTNGTNVRLIDVPENVRFLDVYHAIAHTTAVVVNQTPVVRVYGKVPFDVVGAEKGNGTGALSAQLPETIDPTNFEGDPLTDYDGSGNGAPWWLPLYDPENSAYDLTLPTTIELNATITGKTNVVRALTGRRYVLVQGAQQLVCLVKTAATYTAGTKGMILGQFWA